MVRCAEKNRFDPLSIILVWDIFVIVFVIFLFLTNEKKQKKTPHWIDMFMIISFLLLNKTPIQMEFLNNKGIWQDIFHLVAPNRMRRIQKYSLKNAAMQRIRSELKLSFSSDSFVRWIFIIKFCFRFRPWVSSNPVLFRNFRDSNNTTSKILVRILLFL